MLNVQQPSDPSAIKRPAELRKSNKLYFPLEIGIIGSKDNMCHEAAKELAFMLISWISAINNKVAPKVLRFDEFEKGVKKGDQVHQSIFNLFFDIRYYDSKKVLLKAQKTGEIDFAVIPTGIKYLEENKIEWFDDFAPFTKDKDIRLTCATCMEGSPVYLCFNTTETITKVYATDLSKRIVSSSLANYKNCDVDNLTIREHTQKCYEDWQQDQGQSAFVCPKAFYESHWKHTGRPSIELVTLSYEIEYRMFQQNIPAKDNTWDWVNRVLYAFWQKKYLKNAVGIGTSALLFLYAALLTNNVESLDLFGFKIKPDWIVPLGFSGINYALMHLLHKNTIHLMRMKKLVGWYIVTVNPITVDKAILEKQPNRYLHPRIAKIELTSKGEIQVTIYMLNGVGEYLKSTHFDYNPSDDLSANLYIEFSNESFKIAQQEYGDVKGSTRLKCILDDKSSKVNYMQGEFNLQPSQYVHVVYNRMTEDEFNLLEASTFLKYSDNSGDRGTGVKVTSPDPNPVNQLTIFP